MTCAPHLFLLLLESADELKTQTCVAQERVHAQAQHSAHTDTQRCTLHLQVHTKADRTVQATISCPNDNPQLLRYCINRRWTGCYDACSDPACNRKYAPSQVKHSLAETDTGSFV